MNPFENAIIQKMIGEGEGAEVQQLMSYQAEDN